MQVDNYKKLVLAASLLSISAGAFAYSARSDTPLAHSDGIGAWFSHQFLNTDVLLTVLMLGLVVTLAGGRALFRRRRSRRQLISG